MDKNDWIVLFAGKVETQERLNEVILNVEG